MAEEVPPELAAGENPPAAEDMELVAGEPDPKADEAAAGDGGGEEPKAKRPREEEEEEGEEEEEEEDAEEGGGGGGGGAAKKQKVEEKSVEEERLEKGPGPGPGPAKVGPKEFGSAVEMFDYFFKFLHFWPANVNVNKYEYMTLLELIKKGHSEPEKKIGAGIKAFQVRFHPTFKSKCFFLIREDDSMDDFSFRKCVDHIVPLPEEMKAKEGVSRALGGDKGHGGRGGRGRGGRGRGRGRRGKH